jgi:hypothetical protein
MVIANLSTGNYLHISACPTFAKKCQQRVMTIQLREGGKHQYGAFAGQKETALAARKCP